MKKCLPIFKVLSLVVVILLTAISVNAQRVASVPGNWSVAATWGGAAPPTAAETVTVNDGVNVFVDVAASCASLTILGGTTATTFTVSTGQSLTVTTSMGGTGNITVNAGTDGTSARTINLAGTGTLTAVSMTLADVLPGNSATLIAVGSGIATLSTDLTMNGAGAENTITIGATGDLLFGGTVSQINGTITPAAGGNVEYNGAAQTVRPNTYSLLTLSGSGVKTLPAAGLAVTDLTMAGSASATTAGAIVIGDDIVLNNSSSLTTGATFTVTGTTTLNNTSSLTTGSVATFNNDVTINAGTNFTVGGFDFASTANTVVGGTFTSNSTAGTKTIDNLTISVGGVFNSTVNEDYTMTGNLIASGALTSGDGIWTFSGASSLGGTATINNATFTTDYSNTGTYTFDDLVVSGAGSDFTNNGTVTVVTTMTGTGEFIQGAGDFLFYSGIAAPAITTFTATAAGNTVNYNLIVAQTVRPVTYSNLSLTGSGTKDITGLASVTGNFLISGINTTATTAAVLTIGGTLTVGSSAILNLAGFTFTVAGATIITGTINSTSLTGAKTFDDLTITVGGVFNSTVNEDYAITGFLNQGGTLTAGTGLWTFSGAGNPTNSGVATIANATFSNSYLHVGIYTHTALNVNAGESLTNNGSITVTTTLGGGGSFIQGIADLLNFGGASITITTFTATAAGNTVDYNAAGAQIVEPVAHQNILLTGSGAKTLTGATVALLLSIQGTTTTTGTTPTYAAAAVLEYRGSASHTQGIEWGAVGQPANVTMNTLGGSTLTLTAPKTISGLFTFTSGVVNTTAVNILIFNDGATSSLLATNETSTSFVSGPVRKVGNDIFVFPIGAATGFVPLSIAAPDNVGDALTAQYFRGIPVENTDITAPGINHISACDFWDLTEFADLGVATTIAVTLFWNQNNPCNAPTPYVTDPATIRAVEYLGGSWSAAGVAPGTGTASDGSVVFAGVSAFATFTLGSTSGTTNPLPVKFVDVKAYEKGTGVQIDWSNLTESDLVKYVVERSADGQTYAPIGEQLPRSNQASKESYSKFDASPLGVNFYRISAIEYSGKTIYSKVLRVDMSSDTKSISVYPNPTRDNQVSVSLNTRKGVYMLRIFNNAGQEVMAKQLNLSGGAFTQTVELPASVKAGVYNLLISGDNYRQTKTFIVQ